MSDTNPLLAALSGQGWPTIDPSQVQNQPPPEVQNAPPPQETMTQNQPITAPPTPQQQLKSATTPGLPAIVSLIGQMIHPQGQVQSGQMPRPPSRLDEFEKFLGNFSVSLAQGMAASGHGPGANIRGAAGAMLGPRQMGIENIQNQQQLAQQQAQQQETQARAALTQAQAEQAKNVVMTPYGPMQASLAEKIFGAQIAAGAKTGAAQIAAQASTANKRFIVIPNMGVFDTKANLGQGAMVPGGSNGVTVTPDIQKQYGLPDQLIGKTVSINQLASAERGQNSGLSTVTGAAGPAVVNKVAALKGSPGAVRSLGLGSPAANPIAQANLQIKTAEQALNVGKNQGQINLTIPRLQNLHDNADVIANMLDAGKISLSTATDGTVHAVVARQIKLTPKETKFASDFVSSAEAINLLRGPQGGQGFRSFEAFKALQAQRGSLSQNPDVFKGVLENTIADFKSLQDVNQQALNTYKSIGGGSSSAAKPSGGGNRVIDLRPHP